MDHSLRRMLAKNQLRCGVIGLCIVVLAMLWGAIGLYLHDDQAQILASARISSANLSRTVATHVTSTLSMVDRILLHLKADYERDPAHFDANVEFGEIQPIPGVIIQSTFTNADGFLIAGAPVQVSNPIYVGDGRNFRLHATTDTDAMLIGAPMIGHLSGQWSIQLTRRLNRKDGSFAGVIAIAFDPRYLWDLFRDLDVGKHGLVVVVGEDMVIRAANDPSGASRLGQSMVASHLVSFLSSAPTGSYEAKNARDGIERVVSYRTLADYPLIVLTGVAHQDILVHYYQKRVWLIVVAIIISISFLILTVLLIRRVDAEAQTQAALRLRTAELARAYRRFEQVMETSPMAFVSLTPSTDVLTWSPGAERIFGYEAREVIGHPYPLVPPDRMAEFDRLVEVALKGEFHQGVETQRRHKDGTLVDVRFSGGVILNLEQQTREIFTIVEDITDRKRAEHALRASEARFRGLLDANPDATIIHDATGRVVLASPRIEALFGYKPTEIVGRSFDILMPERHRTAHFKNLHDDPRTTRAVSSGLEVFGLHQDGREFPVEISLSPYQSDDGILMIASIRDITERLQAQERLRQAEKMEAVGQLTGGIAHDFNNLLATILGNTELLEWDEGVHNDETLESIAAIGRAAKRAAQLTQQLLAYSRKQALKPSVQDINRLIRGMANMLRPMLGERITVDVMLGAGPLLSYIDGNQLENALLNLAINARDAMPDGGRLTIETTIVILDAVYVAANPGMIVGEYIQISVNDTGIGMTKDSVQRAFEPFYTTKPLGRGTGLGLSQVYGFVKQSYGQIKLSSELGLGSTVKIYLPRYRVSDEPKLVLGEPLDTKLPGGTETVLVVEDELAIREMSVRALTRLGYRVLTADSADRALTVLDHDSEIALLFTDIVLPGKDGKHLAEEAWKRAPNLKVLFTTGYARSPAAHGGVPGHDVHLLPKPFTIGELASRLRNILDRPPP